MANSYSDYGINGTGRLLVPGTLRGYRAWRMDDRGRLWSIHSAWPGAESEDFWTTARYEAQCRIDMMRLPSFAWPLIPQSSSDRPTYTCSPAPGRDCKCGIYASYNAYDYRHSVPKFWHEDESGRGNYFVHGCVKATGRMVLAVKGFRAQYAQIEALWGWGSRWVARKHDIPWFMTQRSFLNRYPSSTLSEILPERLRPCEWEELE